MTTQQHEMEEDTFEEEEKPLLQQHVAASLGVSAIMLTVNLDQYFSLHFFVVQRHPFSRRLDDSGHYSTASRASLRLVSLSIPVAAETFQPSLLYSRDTWAPQNPQAASPAIHLLPLTVMATKKKPE